MAVRPAGAQRGRRQRRPIRRARIRGTIR